MITRFNEEVGHAYIKTISLDELQAFSLAIGSAVSRSISGTFTAETGFHLEQGGMTVDESESTMECKEELSPEKPVWMDIAWQEAKVFVLPKVKSFPGVQSGAFGL